MKLRTIVTISSIVVIILAVIVLLYPDLPGRWLTYNTMMLKRVTSNVLPFFLMQWATAFLVLSIEVYVVGWKKSSLHQFLHPDRSSINDLCTFAINTLQIDYVILFLLTFGLTHKLELGLKLAVGFKEGLLASWISHVALQLICYILLMDFMMFFQHFLHHKLSFLWPFHSYHHSATELNVLTANRGHPVQGEFSNILITFIPLSLAGVPLISLLWYKLLRNTITFMQHSRITWKWGWIGQHVIASPAYHRIHHSILKEHYDKNLAILFPAWDHLFGTYYRGNIPAMETGLPDNPYHRKHFFDDMLVPFRMFRKREKTK